MIIVKFDYFEKIHTYNKFLLPITITLIVCLCIRYEYVYVEKKIINLVIHISKSKVLPLTVTFLTS